MGELAQMLLSYWKLCHCHLRVWSHSLKQHQSPYQASAWYGLLSCIQLQLYGGIIELLLIYLSPVGIIWSIPKLRLTILFEKIKTIAVWSGSAYYFFEKRCEWVAFALAELDIHMAPWVSRIKFTQYHDPCHELCFFPSIVFQLDSHLRPTIWYLGDSHETHWSYRGWRWSCAETCWHNMMHIE